MRSDGEILPKTQITTTYADNGNLISEVTEDYEENRVSVKFPLKWLGGNTDTTDPVQLTQGDYTIEIYQTEDARDSVSKPVIKMKDDPFVLKFYHHDHLGTVRYITNESGEILHTTDTLAYGEELTAPYEDTNDKVLNTITYTGHEKDYETNLTYMMARYYSQGYGRFLSPDPGYDYDQLDPMSWNLYAYVRGNPVKHLDPTGMWNRGGLEMQHTIDMDEKMKESQKQIQARKKARETFEKNSGRSAADSNSNKNDGEASNNSNTSQLEHPEERPADGWYYTLTASVANAAVPKKLVNLKKSFRLISVEGGEVYVINPKTNKVFKFHYIAGGLGFSVPGGFGGASLELGMVSLDKLSDFKGIGVGISFMAVAEKGFSGQIYGAPWSQSYGTSLGFCMGAGGSLSPLLIYTWGGEEVKDFSKLSDTVKNEIKSLLY